MITEKLQERALPDVLLFESGERVDGPDRWARRREEIVALLSREIYGFSPAPPPRVEATPRETETDAFAGKAVHSVVDIRFDTPAGEFSFPVHLVVPRDRPAPPLFLHIAFRPAIPDRYYPAEEIVDAGFAVASFCYEDIAPDRDDGFSGGLAGMYATSARKPTDWGKISMWAWAAQRVMDWLQVVDDIDAGRVAVVGHSRLGKTALWCAAQDQRFLMGISNNSGCSGAALSRGKTGERIRDITNRFGYWFCDNYRKYRDAEPLASFDQHFLLAAIAPRPVYVASAERDAWSDPESEFLACAAAGGAYALHGLKGLVTEDRLPLPGTRLHEGEIGYHLRAGTHYLSREDWRCFIDYIAARR